MTSAVKPSTRCLEITNLLDVFRLLIQGVDIVWNQSEMIPDVITCRVVTLILVQFPLDDYYGRRLMLSLAAVWNRLMWTVPCGQDKPPRYRHDDHDIVQAHVRHIDQIHGQNLVAHLHVRMHGDWRIVR